MFYMFDFEKQMFNHQQIAYGDICYYMLILSNQWFISDKRSNPVYKTNYKKDYVNRLLCITTSFILKGEN
jgi:hypothetical protein